MSDAIPAPPPARPRKNEGSRFMPLLALVICLMFATALAWLLVFGMPERGGEALLVMLGTLGGAFSGVVAYYYGSSVDSRKKTDAIIAERAP